MTSKKRSRRSRAGEKRSRPKSGTSGSPVEDRESSGNKRRRLGSRRSPPSTPKDSIQESGVSNTYHECAGQFQDTEEIGRPSQDVLSSLRSATCTAKDKQAVVAGIQVTDVVDQAEASCITEEEARTLSVHLLGRFERLGDLAVLEQAITILVEVIRTTSALDDRHRTGLGSLGVALLYRFNHCGELSDLEDAISRHRDAVALTPHGHPHRPEYLNNVGKSYKARFERLGELNDIEDAITTLRETVDLTPHNHPDKPTYLRNLGNSCKARFDRLGQLGDLEDAVLMLRDAIDLAPHDHPHKPTYLNNLGNSLVTRFERLGELVDLENAISMLKSAVDLTPHGHPDKPGYLTNLGDTFRTRFERLGKSVDLKNATSTLKKAVDSIPPGHPDKPMCLNSIGNTFVTRFERLGKLVDLEKAVSTLKDAVNRVGEQADLEDAISTLIGAVDLTPHDHPDKPMYLNNLGTSFLARFEHLGELSDLENTVLTLRDAVDLTPHGHPDKSGYLGNLGDSFRTRFERLGELVDLENAISMLSSAVDLTPHDHPDKPMYLNNLGNTFAARFDRLGEPDDIEKAISTLKAAVNLTPHDHPDKPGYLNNLGTCFVTRLERLGELVDLENAISTLRNAVDLSPDDLLEKPAYLHNLGTSFLTRFERLGELSDLEDAISTVRDAVDLTPRGHPDKPMYLNSLGSSFRTRFQRLGELVDLENSMSMLRDAVDFTPHGHPDKPIYLNSLGNALVARFEHFGELVGLESAVLQLSNAVNLTPDGHPDKPDFLNSLGGAFVARYERLGELVDLKNAISTLTNAIELTPRGHPDKPMHLNTLGNTFVTRFERLGELKDLHDAISLFSHAAIFPFGPSDIRFHASQRWISCARRLSHHSLLHAYYVAINLLPQLAWIGLPLAHRYSELKRGADVVREAAAAALAAGLPETAVEWLEQGRSIVWGELLQLRSSYEDLSSAHPDHARRLRELSVALENASASREKSLALFSGESRPSLQQEADRHRTLAIERDKLLQTIRGLPGFEQFLLRKEFSQLRASVHSGPVVILNAAENRCDALIVVADVDHVIHVPLPNFTFERSTGLQKIMKTFLRHARREGKTGTLDGVSWESFLAPLWKCVCQPVLDALAFSLPGDLSRIFWCPTGPFVFLPIHAAGFYDSHYSRPGHKVYDFVISTYIPTLSALVLPPNPSTAPHTSLRLLAVRQPPSDGLGRLPGVHTELEHIKDVIRDSPSTDTTYLESSAGTVEEVLGLMKESDWVHFACHGIQDAASPTESGLCLANQRRLTLRDILALSRPHGGLAFLSACQTATGDEDLSDEAIHIAAGMLFAGYGGVVGTMWSISDKIAPDVARDVYEQLFGNEGRPDYREAARALHEAIGRLRESGNVSFAEWIPFIHVGL
ncbi:CHAT domain-containing protein [Boletus edulis BED1]|uniref:CHAT domain-containing protein n=1 Tax=Boletus edulis BED1 TaxID=1328754 RepID=A0AAD4BP92_BOLED|nr:CHAT domain-containing protein [Boletus edulis BED1]